MKELEGHLVREGYRAGLSSCKEEELIEAVNEIIPEILVVDCTKDVSLVERLRIMIATECQLRELLVIAVFLQEQTDEIKWAGIDEIVFYPIVEKELFARLRLSIWRNRKIDSDKLIKVEGLLIDLSNYEITIDGLPVEVTFKEYELLRFLATHKGRVFTREALLNHVWGYDYYGGTRTIDVHIRRLRSKLAPSYDHLIETVRNVGYRFLV